MTAFFCLGGFLGPTVGGAGQQSVGFAWTATVMAGLCLLIGIALTVFQIHNRCCGGVDPAQEALRRATLLNIAGRSDGERTPLKNSYLGTITLH